MCLHKLTEITNEKHPELFEEVKEVQSRLLSVCQNFKLLRQNQNNPEIKVEICRKICLGYARSPDLRVTWMNLISQINNERLFLEEAAQTYIVLAVFIIQFLEFTDRMKGFKIAAQDLQKVSPNILLEEFRMIEHDCENVRLFFL